MGSRLRRQLREALPPGIKGLPRAVALEIADDARWDDARHYDPDGGRHSRATLADLARWTAAKNERVIRDALRTLSLAGWEFRVPFGKGKDGRLLYAVPGRAAEFRVPDFEYEEAVVTVSSDEEAVVTVKGPVTTASKAVTTASEAVVTGPPSHVSQSPKDHTTSPTSAEPVDTDPPAAPDVTDGGGGGSDLRSTAIHIAAALDYHGKPPTQKQRTVIEDRLVVFLEADWSIEELAVLLDTSGQLVRYAPGLYMDRLDPAEVRNRRPLPAGKPPATGHRPFACPPDSEYGGGFGAAGGTDATVAGWGEVARQLAAREQQGYQPFRNPIDQDVYDQPF